MLHVFNSDPATFFYHCIPVRGACPGGAVGSVAVSGWRSLAMVIGKSGFEAQAGRVIVSGYSGVCLEIKFSGRHRRFNCVLFKM